MGLAEVKRKQRLVGSAQTKNSAWSNDSSLPGQRLLASMGWSAGQGIGQSKSGMVAPVAVAFKMDNKGIGAQRLEREARASGQADAWIGGGGELGSLFDRLNAAAASSASTSTSTAVDEEKTKKEEKERRKAEKKEKKKEKAKELDNEKKAIEQKSASTPVMINPRMAARAKYLRAKRMVGNDLSSINEILGIASPSGSNSPAPIASPALSPKPADLSSEEGETTESERKKEKKRKREGSEIDDKDGSKSSSKSDKEERKRRKEEKKLAKASKKEEKRKTKEDNTSQPASVVVQDTSDPSFSASGGGNRVSSLSVQQYLSNKLMLRKAEIVRKRRLQEEGVWSRAATVQA